MFDNLFLLHNNKIACKSYNEFVINRKNKKFYIKYNLLHNNKTLIYICL